MSYVIGFEGIDPAVQTIVDGGVYLLTIRDPADAIDICLTAKRKNLALVQWVMEEAPVFLDNLPEKAEGTSDLYVYKSRVPLIECLGDAIHAQLCPSGTSLLALVHKDLFDEDAEDVQETLLKLSTLAQEKNVSVLIVVCNDTSESLREKILDGHRTFRGIGQISKGDDGILVHVEFWTSEQSVSFDRDYQLEKVDGHLVRKSESSSDKKIADDSDEIFAVVDTPIDSYLRSRPNTKLFPDNKSLVEAASGSRAATLLLTAEDSRDLNELLNIIYQVRRNSGRNLKIIVLEKSGGFREFSEEMLLGCGANLLLPSTTKSSYMVAILRSLKGNVYSHNYEENYICYSQASDLMRFSGIVEPHFFASTIKNCLRALYGKGICHGCLVALKFAPGVGMDDVVPQLNKSRSGDIVCFEEDKVFLFFWGARASELPYVLSLKWKVPVTSLFSDQISFTTDAEIINVLGNSHILDQQVLYKPSVSKPPIFGLQALDELLKRPKTEAAATNIKIK